MRKRDPMLVSLGLNIRRHREAQDLTQEELGERAGIDQTYISGIERGIRNPGIKSVARVAKAMKLRGWV